MILKILGALYPLYFVIYFQYLNPNIGNTLKDKNLYNKNV